jgi:hypothetical protein
VGGKCYAAALSDFRDIIGEKKRKEKQGGRGEMRGWSVFDGPTRVSMKVLSVQPAGLAVLSYYQRCSCFVAFVWMMRKVSVRIWIPRTARQ